MAKAHRSIQLSRKQGHRKVTKEGLEEIQQYGWVLGAYGAQIAVPGGGQDADRP
jgi:hypothetical protein